MSYTATGKIYKILDAQRVNDKLTKREFVLEIQDGQYPQMVKFELTNEKCDLLDRFSVGETVSVRFYLRGREWVNPKGEVVFFNSLSAQHVEEGEPGQARDSSSGKTRFEGRDVDKTYEKEKKSGRSAYAPAQVEELEKSDDLPF